MCILLLIPIISAIIVIISSTFLAISLVPLILISLAIGSIIILLCNIIVFTYKNLCNIFTLICSIIVSILIYEYIINNTPILIINNNISSLLYDLPDILYIKLK